MGILAATAFSIFSITSRPKGYNPGQLIFVRYLILLIKHRMDWGLIRQQKQKQIMRDNARDNNIQLTMTIRSDIKLCSLTTLKKIRNAI